jgi:hypothetical protein
MVPEYEEHGCENLAQVKARLELCGFCSTTSDHIAARVSWARLTVEIVILIDWKGASALRI